ncbi:MAG: hypothetical protein JWM50_2399 [Microbacteriaceae bacterium]|jgi:hypothetical protein|nr:hypothetical protein [Microbacteriaceae bacterium]
MDHHEDIDGATPSGSQDPHPEGTEGSLLSPGTSATGGGTTDANNDVPAVSDSETDYTTTEQSGPETDAHTSYTSSDLGEGDENRVGSETGTTEADISDGREQKLPRVD